MAQEYHAAVHPVSIRWLLSSSDMEDVLRIERESFEFPWSRDDFMTCLRSRNCIGMVAESKRDGRTIVGFMIYELHRGRLELLNMAVAPELRRRSIGQQMVQRLFGKLEQQGRTEIRVTVRERNLLAQLFFRSQCFRCIDSLPDYYDGSEILEDGYVFQYHVSSGIPETRRLTD